MPNFKMEVDEVTVRVNFHSGDPNFNRLAREFICNQIATGIAELFGNGNPFPINFLILVNGQCQNKAEMN